jgi:hypothetical protein
MNRSLAEAPIADVAADLERRAGMVKGEAAESSQRAAQPTLDQHEHRSHNLSRRRWARATTSQPAHTVSRYRVNPKSRSR